MHGRWALVAIAVVCLPWAATAHADDVCLPDRGVSRVMRVRPICKPTERRLGSLAGFERLLAALSAEDAGTTLRLSGVNLQLVNGSGATSGTANGLGNLIVGYNEPPPAPQPDSRAGSHNLVVGPGHRYASYGGMVVGEANAIGAPFAAVGGGVDNEANAGWSVVSGGIGNDATGIGASVSGGISNKATGPASAVSGGAGNLASGESTSVSGGHLNVAGCESEWCAQGAWAAVSGGRQNVALGYSAWIGGGHLNRISSDGLTGAISGGLSNQVTGWSSSVHGGQNNVAGPDGQPTDVVGEPGLTTSATVCGGRANHARGRFSAIGGGASLVSTSEDGWAAGSLGAGGPFVGPHRSE